MSKTIEELELELKTLKEEKTTLIKEKLELNKNMEKYKELEDNYKISTKKLAEIENKEKNFQLEQLLNKTNIDKKHYDMVKTLIKGMNSQDIENELNKENYQIFKTKGELDTTILDNEANNKASQDKNTTSLTDYLERLN